MGTTTKPRRSKTLSSPQSDAVAKPRSTTNQPSHPFDGETLKGSADGATYQLIHRSKLKNAPYNPRVIDPVSFRRLKESIERTKGLVEPPVWNKRTGNLVGGHQRLEVLDILKKTMDYTLVVAVVDLTEPQEIELNIALNNPNLSGQYDLNLLDDLLGRTDVEIGHTGFDITTLELLHMDAHIDLPSWMLPEEEVESQTDIEELAEAVEDAAQEAEDAKADEAEQTDIDLIKQRKKDFADRQAFLRHQRVSIRFIFPTEGSRDLIMQHLALDPDGETVDGMTLVNALGLTVDAKTIIESETPQKIKDKQARKSRKKNPPDTETI